MSGGTTFAWYQTPYPRSDVLQTRQGRQDLIREVLEYLDGQGHDFSWYAADGDGRVSGGLVTGPQVQQLLSRLEVSRRPDGGVTIDAPPEAAEALAAIFAGMAGLITQAVPSATEDS